MAAAITVDAGDPAAIPRLVAERMLKQSGVREFSATYLGDAIAEINVETQTAGPALLQLSLIDPEHRILRSAICAKGTDGFLQPIDINFPEGTSVWWRLAMIEPSDGDGTSANLTMTFQHRTVAYLMRCAGALGWPKRNVGQTRAQFLDFLVKKCASELPKNLVGAVSADGSGGPSDVHFVCPDLNEIQPVASANVYSTEVITSASAAAQKAGINKLPGLTKATSITIEGQKPSAQQIENINTILGVGTSLGASQLALASALYAGMGESDLLISTGGTGGAQGVFQSEPGDYDSGQDLAGQAKAFFTGGKDFQAGGAIKLANQGLPVWKIANMVEANKVFNETGGDSYQSRWAGGTKQGEAEAAAIVNAFNGGTSGVTGTSVSDIAQLTRGSVDNPFEDSWTCMQRLASEVNWMLFTCVQPHPGQWGNFIYFMDGTAAVAQKPSLYLSLSNAGDIWTAQDPHTGRLLNGSGDGMVNNVSATIDNSAFQVYEATDLAASTGAKSGSAKVTKATRVQRPQTPSTFQFNLILGQAGVLRYSGGDVFVLRNAGPFDGRWIVEDVTHNILGDEFAQITLGPPEFAYPEPQANTVAVVTASGQVINVSTSAAAARVGAAAASSLTDIQQGALSGVADAAKKALGIQQKSRAYHYKEIRPMPSSLFPPPGSPIDCSTFATLCYKAAGLPDPNGPKYNYNGYGNTDSLYAYSTRISEGDAKPGDICLFGVIGSNGCSTSHVNVYIGNGQSISMGQEGEPAQGASPAMGPSGFLGYFRSHAVSKISASNPVDLSKPTAQQKTPIETVGGGLLGGFGGSPAGVFKDPFSK